MVNTKKQVVDVISVLPGLLILGLQGLLGGLSSNPKNKIMSLALIGVGVASWKLLGDGSALILMLTIAIPCFFDTENWTEF